MPISAKYKFYLTYPDGSTKEVAPINNELTWKWQYNEKLKTFRYLLDTKLCFTNNETDFTFDDLYDLERQCGICPRVDIRVDKYCGDEWKEHWIGYLPFKKGEWDIDACTAEIKPVVDDIFTCITRNWKNKKNLLELTDRVTINNIEGEVQCTTVSSSPLGGGGPVTPAPPAGPGWTVTQSIVNNFNGLYTSNYIYCREVWTGSAPPVTSGWTQYINGYYRPLTITGCVTTVENDGTGGDINETVTNVCSYLDIEIDNAITLQSALEFLLEDCETPVCSDFLNINPVGDAPNNHAYTCADEYLSNVALFQASDVIRPDADQNATIFTKCFFDLWCDLSERLNLQMWHDKTNNCIRIEHISYRLDGTVYSMTEVVDGKIVAKERYANCLRGLRKYKYDKLDFPLSETFSDKVETIGSPDFNDASILYDVNCADDDIDTQDKEYSQKCTITDVTGIYNNSTYIEDLDVMQSMVLVALDANNQIISSPGPISGSDQINGPLSWASVIECYWLDQRPLIYGEMNGQTKQFLSTIPQRQQNGVSFCMTCEEWEMFSPYMGVKTQFGVGYIDSEVTLTDCGGLVSMTLKFPCSI